MRIVGARRTNVQIIESAQAQSFLEVNHRSGAVGLSTKAVSLGLFERDELLAVIQFSSPRTAAMKERYTVELLRMAFKNGVRIPGGASKLIAAYIKLFNPSDFFTYQDTTGETTSVYEQAGMTLVSQAKRKQYLVAPGKTIETGSRKEVLGMAYATRYGPDRILGTKLGEVFREDGTRKTNPQLFLEELGWHLEETSGDRVYEWVNPQMTFYTYKITASDSDKYYYGVKRLHRANASAEDCLADPYFGSGGKSENNKFRNWVKLHSKTLQKEIIGVHSSRQQAFREERALIGDLWRTDKLCLNSRAGGAISPPSSLEGKAKAVCPIHGEVGFVGQKCRSCLLVEQESLQSCSIHGEGSHFAGHCRKCLIEKSYSEGVCEKHGEGIFQNGKCLRCTGSAKISRRKCPIHGESLHIGPTCSRCNSRKAFAERECPTHGKTSFVGEKCSKCIHSGSFYLDSCSVHGEVKHKGGNCYKCQLAKAWSKQDCPKHGKAVTFHGVNCLRCSREAKKAATS